MSVITPLRMRICSVPQLIKRGHAPLIKHELILAKKLRVSGTKGSKGLFSARVIPTPFRVIQIINEKSGWVMV